MQRKMFGTNHDNEHPNTENGRLRHTCGSTKVTQKLEPHALSSSTEAVGLFGSLGCRSVGGVLEVSEARLLRVDVEGLGGVL